MSELEATLTKAEYDTRVKELAEAVYLDIISEADDVVFTETDISEALDRVITDDDVDGLYIDHPVSVCEHADSDVRPTFHRSSVLDPKTVYQRTARTQLVQDIMGLHETVLEEYAEYDPETRTFTRTSDPESDTT